MSRQRLRPSLGDSTQLTCPRCKGQGTIRNVESVTLAVLRLIEEDAMKKGTERVIAHLPIDCATFLLNEKRATLQELEARLQVSIVVLPSKHLETPAYDIERIKSLEGMEDKPSHLQIKEDDITVPEFAKQATAKAERAAVKEFLPDAPAPVQNKKTSTSLIQRFWHRLVGQSKTQDTAESTTKTGETKTRSARNNNRRDRPTGGRNPRRNNNNRRGENPTQTTDNSSIDEKKQDTVESTNTPDNAQNNPASTSERPARRNRNRRRSPRNTGDKRPENNGVEGENQERTTASPTNVTNDDQPRSYNSEFAERKQRAEGSEAQSTRTTESPAANPAPTASED
jgi:ribonuclease E